MAIKPEYKEVNGVKYACTMMPALTSNTVLTKLVAMVGRPSLVLAAGAVQMSEDNEEAKSRLNEIYANLVEIGINQVFAELTPDQSNEVMLLMMKGVRFDGCPQGKDLSDPDLFDEHFRGRLFDAYQVWAWALTVNYQAFFDFARSTDTLSRLKAVGTKVLSGLTLTQKSQESAAQTKESTDNSTTSSKQS